MVVHDDFDGSCQVADHLIALGHTRIAFLGNARARMTSQGRLNGLRHAMETAGLSVPEPYVFYSPNGRPAGGEIGAKYFLALSQPPTAVMCFNDMQAIGVLKALREADRLVPGDLSITGFDDISLAAYVYPSLTTFQQPEYLLGFQAAHLMIRLLQSGKDEDENNESLQPQVLRGKLIVRESTGLI